MLRKEIRAQLRGSGAGVGWWDRGGGFGTSMPEEHGGCDSGQALSVMGPKCWVDEACGHGDSHPGQPEAWAALLSSRGTRACGSETGDPGLHVGPSDTVPQPVS